MTRQYSFIESSKRKGRDMIRNVLEMLEHSAARVPDKTALKDENESLTYK